MWFLMLSACNDWCDNSCFTSSIFWPFLLCFFRKETAVAFKVATSNPNFYADVIATGNIYLVCFPCFVFVLLLLICIISYPCLRCFRNSESY